ncbi:unnamed protein product [Adineta steineri]|uniref:PKS/mFAS DH domain-containing protein n=2 Tax=Adineta steineri TaxID=433720 RepID=A0A819PLG9_9BILA|nr:unnamed protein product [Adineta steineri]
MYEKTVRFYDAIAAIIKDEAANVFLEISPHPVLATSIRECCKLTNQQQSSPLILLTLKRKEDEQITLLTSLAQFTTSSQVWQQYFHTRQILPMKNHAEYFDNFPLYKFHLSPCWYESKGSSIQRLANCMPAHPLLGIRQLNEQTSATWKSLININLPQHAFLQDHKIQDATLFPAVVYLELATAACQQLLSSKEDDQQQPTIIFEDINFIKALILNEHELMEVFTQIIMPMREWSIILCNQDNLNKYSLNKFTLHAQDITSAYQYGSSFQKTIKTLRGTSATIISQLLNDNNNCSSYYLLHPYLVILPGVETTFLPVRILKSIYSSKTKTKMNQSTNIEVCGNYYDNICGIGQEKIYNLNLWIFLMDNKIEEPIFTFEGAVIQQVQGAHFDRWSVKKIIYDKLNLTTDLPNTDHKPYLDTIIKDDCMKRVWTDSPITKDISHLLPSPKSILNNELNSISNQDLIESIEPFNELAVYYAQMAIKDLDLNQQHHPLLSACRSLASTLREQVTWHSTQLCLVQLIERFPRLKPFLVILNKYGLHLKDILRGEKNGSDIFLGDDEIGQIFHSICQHLQLQYEQQIKDNSFQNYRLRIFWLTDSHCLLIDLHYADSDPIQLANAQQTFSTHINNQTKNLCIIYDETIDLYDSKTLEKIPIESFDIILSANQLLGNQDLTKKNSLISLRRLLVPNGLLLLLELVHVPLYFDLIFGFFDQWWSSDNNNRSLNSIQQWKTLLEQIKGFNIIESTLNENENIICSSISILLTTYKQISIIFAWQLDQVLLNENNDDLAFKQNEELLRGTLSRILQIIQKSSPYFYPFVYVLTDHAQFNNDSNLNIIPSPFIGLARSLITEYERN